MTQKRNQTDSQGRKQGLWEEHHEREEHEGGITTKIIITAKGHYVDGLKQGPWEDRQEGRITAEGNYKDDKWHGVMRWYYPTGNLSDEEYWENDEQYGVWKTYYKAGSIMRETIWGSREKVLLGSQENALVIEYKKEGPIVTAHYEKDGEILYHLDDKEIQFYTTIISTMGHDSFMAIPRELFSYLHYTNLF